LSTVVIEQEANTLSIVKAQPETIEVIAPGPQGVNGLSAYEIALVNGFAGTEAAWLLSLQGAVGAQGPAGANGANGLNGADGINGANGVDGADGANGLSAYEIAVTNGFVGTEAAWLLSLQGANGADGLNGANGSDATVTYANVTAALGFTPADAAVIGDIEAALVAINGGP
jgi:hypothetical protein